MSSFRPMRTAPEDGTRVLIHTWVHLWAADGWTKVGSEIREGRFRDGKWEPWGGKEGVTSTLTLDPIEWAPRPETTSIWPYE